MNTQEMIELIENTEHQPRFYSGRGMYGKRCLAVDANSIIGLVASLIEACSDYEQVMKLVNVLRSAKTDSMGLGEVLYFPKLEWVE